MELKMETTNKFFCIEEDIAEQMVEKAKNDEEGTLVDWKISRKETKDGEYFIVTLKTRYLTLTEAKAQL